MHFLQDISNVYERTNFFLSFLSFILWPVEVQLLVTTEKFYMEKVFDEKSIRQYFK